MRNTDQIWVQLSHLGPCWHTGISIEEKSQLLFISWFYSINAQAQSASDFIHVARKQASFVHAGLPSTSFTVLNQTWVHLSYEWAHLSVQEQSFQIRRTSCKSVSTSVANKWLVFLQNNVLFHLRFTGCQELCPGWTSWRVQSPFTLPRKISSKTSRLRWTSVSEEKATLVGKLFFPRAIVNTGLYYVYSSLVNWGFFRWYQQFVSSWFL